MPLQFQPMSDQDYTDWLAILIPDFAAEKVASGAWTKADSLKKAQASTAELLPQGRDTSNQYMFTLVLMPEAHRVGYLWFGRYEQSAYLYDIYITPDHRRMGYGRQAMQLLETAASERGFTAIALHVFGKNRIARDLYRQQGFEITDLTMRKKLPAANPATDS